MAIRVLEKVNEKSLIKELTLRGWEEGKFNGKQAMFKEFETYLWVVSVLPISPKRRKFQGAFGGYERINEGSRRAFS